MNVERPIFTVSMLPSPISSHAIEQGRPDVLRQCRAWFDGQLDLDPCRLVFIDETWTATNMTRSNGRCAKGERLRMGHRKTTALVSGLRMTGMVAPMVLDGPSMATGSKPMWPRSGRPSCAAATS